VMQIVDRVVGECDAQAPYQPSIFQSSTMPIENPLVSGGRLAISYSSANHPSGAVLRRARA